MKRKMKRLAAIISAVMIVSLFGSVPANTSYVHAEESQGQEGETTGTTETTGEETQKTPVKLQIRNQSGDVIGDAEGEQELSLSLGDSAYTLAAYLGYENVEEEGETSITYEVAADDVTYTITDGSDVISITDGAVTPKKEGTAKVSAAYVVNETVTLTTSFCVNVTNPIVSLSIEPTSVSMKVGDEQTLKSIYTYYDGSTKTAENVCYVSSDPDAVEVDSYTGAMKALAVCDKVEVTALSDDGKFSAVCTVTVTAISVEEITLNASEVSTLTIGDTFQLSAVVTPDNATNQKVTYAVVETTPLNSSVSTTVVKVGKNTGLVTISGLGTAVVEATSADGTVTARCTFTVYQTYFDVTKLGADGTDTANDNSKLNAALKWALAVDEPITVYVPAGTYYIGARLNIYSNTKLVLDSNATIVRQASAASKPMLRSASDVTTGQYTQIENVEITGGVWDGNANGTDYTDNFYIAHGKNIYIHDTTIKNNSGSHLIEFAGVSDSVIDNVVLTGYKLCTKSGYSTSGQTVKEAIQLDYCSKASAPNMTPYDDTICQNITIQNCTISDYMCGIGAHGCKSGVYLKNIVIKNNTFKNITNCCIDLRNFKDVTVSNNVAKSFNTFLYAYNSTGVIKNNTINNKETFTPIVKSYRMYANGIYLSTKSNFTISKNTVSNCGNHGISVGSNSTAIIKNNTVKKNQKYGIKVENATATIKGNTASGNKNGREYYSDAKSKITADHIQAYYVAVNASYKYTGKAIKPAISISGLKKGKAYTVTYKNNKKVGTAKIVIKGKGKKKGKLVLTFKITK